MPEERFRTYTDNQPLQNTVGFGAGIALKKAVCFVRSNGLVFALKKADCSVFKKTENARVFKKTTVAANQRSEIDSEIHLARSPVCR